jgi:hypothetical protein
MKPNVALGVLAVVATAVVGLGRIVPTSTAAERGHQEAFDNASIKGVWGFAGGPGFLVPPAVPKAVPTAGAGIVEFDGAGGCSLTVIINVNGTSVGPLTSATCTYSVNPNGMGSSVAQFSEGPIQDPVPVAFVIVDNKKELQFIQTAVIVGSFVARRQ